MDIQKIEPDDTSNLLNETIKALAEGATGIASSERKDLVLSIGHLFQKIRSGRFLETLKVEWDEYRKKGRIKNDYTKSEQHMSCIQEMLDFLDEDSPDQLRFDFLKKIFLAASSEQVTSRDSYLPQQIMKICRQLSSGEILVLSATHKLSVDKNYPPTRKSVDWLSYIAEISGLKHSELVELHERDLIKKNLISDRSIGDNTAVNAGNNYRLTPLAFDVFKFIQNYDEEKKV